MANDLPELLVPDVAAWRGWLAEHHGEPVGVWLVLAKNGTTDPTALLYDEALEEALCQGWIDGQARRRDAATYLQRFTPRRARSPWSARNVGIVGRLTEEQRMQPAGVAEVDRAKADGRWERAYRGRDGQVVPDDLAAALQAHPDAAAMFEVLTAQNRFAMLYRLGDARRPETRARRLAQFVEMLGRGEAPYPQKRGLPGRPAAGA